LATVVVEDDAPPPAADDAGDDPEGPEVAAAVDVGAESEASVLLHPITAAAHASATTEPRITRARGLMDLAVDNGSSPARLLGGWRDHRTSRLTIYICCKL
jgi:hypothetical protein